MTVRTLALLLAAAFAATALTAPADAKSKRRAPAPQLAAPAVSSMAPARMIEVRPGLWISSYGCIQDDGYGRYTSCDISDGMR